MIFFGCDFALMRFFFHDNAMPRAAPIVANRRLPKQKCSSKVGP